MTLQELGKKIAALRREKGLSQDELCRIAGISRTTLSQLENSELFELGFNKVHRILSCLDKDLSAVNKASLPTLDDLLRQRQEDFDNLPSDNP